MVHATKILSDFAAELRFENIPEQANETAKMYMLDYLASAAAGIKVNGAFNAAMMQIISGMGGREEASVLNSGEKFPVENAAFMNAIYAHGADMDDGNRKAMGHVAAHVMSAVLSLAETREGIAWKDVFTAVHVGYEVYNRVAAAAQPGLVHRGFHSTGTAGAVACGAACAKLMGLDAEGIYNAMAIAAIQASGLIIIAESGQSCKPLNPANAAKTGIISAKLAASGVQGPVFPLESTKGWFHAMTDDVHEEMITDGLGTKFTICESYLKPYPSCRHTHCGIEAALKIREMAEAKYSALDAAEIEAVNVRIYRNAIQIAGQIKVPATVDEAKFSVHYSLANALMYGHFNLSDLSRNIGEAEKDLIEKICLIEDPSMEDVKKGIRGAEVEVVMKDGNAFRWAVTVPKGDAENALTWEELHVKYADCMAEVISAENADAVFEQLRSLNFEEAYGSVYRSLSSK